MNEFDSRLEGDEAEEQLIEQLLERYDEASALGLPAVLPKVEGLSPERARELEALAQRIDLVNQAARQQVTAAGGALGTGGANAAETSAGSDPEAQLDPFAGEMIGRFRVLRELGRGGYGIVFLAFDSGIGRLVAIKLPRPEVLVTPELRSRFLREAQAAGRIDHPHVLPVHEAAEDGGMCYLVMPFCRGLSLAEWFVEHGPVPAHDVAQLAVSLAEALTCAHEAGVLHRDIKPANILLDLAATDVTTDREQLKQRRLATFVPKLTDFGLAKLLQSTELETRTGTLVGTPTYMPPEQSTGRYSDVRTDVYSLGVVMYELLTVQLPAHASAVAGLSTPGATGEIVPPRKLQASIPRDLEAVVLKCLEPAPADRYPSAAALAEDLRRFLDGMPTAARPAGLLRKAWKAARRRPALAAMMLLSTVLLAVLAVGDRWYASRLQRTETALHGGEYARDIRQAAAARKRGAVDEVHTLLNRYEAGRPEAMFRGFEWFWLQNSLRDVGRVISTKHGEVYGVTFSPDGQTLFSSGADGVIQAWDVASGALQFELKGHTSCVNQIAFAPDGVTLGSISCDGTARLWDVRSRKEIRVVANLGRELSSLAFAHQHPWLAIDTHHGQVQVYDIATGDLLVELGEPSVNVHVDAMAFSDTDDLLAATSGVSSHSGVWKTNGWERISDHDFHALALSFVGKQQRLVLGSRSIYHAPRLWNPDPAAGSPDLGKLPSTIQSLAGMHQRDVLFAGGTDGSLYAFDLLGATDRVLLTSKSRIQGLAITPDDRHLASAGYDGKVRLWNLRHDERQIDFGGDKPLVQGLLSPDRRWLAVVDTDTRLMLWNCEENDHENSLRKHMFWGFSPSGNFLIAQNALDQRWALLRVPSLQPVEAVSELSEALKNVVKLTIAADDRTVALLSADKSVTIVDLQNPTLTRKMTLPAVDRSQSVSIALSPDGSRLLWFEWNKLAPQAVNTTSGVLEPLPESLAFLHDVPYAEASIAPDGRGFIAMFQESGDLNYHDIETLGIRAHLRHPEQLSVTCSWSADGRRVVLCTKAGTPIILDPETGETLCELDTALEPIRSNFVFSPNDDQLMAFTADGLSPRGYLSRWRAPRD